MFMRPEVLAAPPYNFTAHPATIKLDQNESPYGLPEILKAKVLRRLETLDLNRYPDLAGESLHPKLAAYHAWEETGVVVSGGSNILIQAFVTAAGIGHSVLTVAPTFSVYPLQAKLQGAKLIEVPLGPDFALPFHELLEQLATNKGVFFLANPAAPTGNVFAAHHLEQLAEASQNNWLFVIDEAYNQFSKTDFSHLVKRYKHVASLRTFSKAFGLGGVRLGYALMGAELAVQLQKLVMPFSISGLQLAVVDTVLGAVLAGDTFVKERIEETLRERATLMSELPHLEDIHVFQSETNFFLMRVPDAAAFYKELLGAGIIIRRQDHLPGLESCVRVSVGTPQENRTFLQTAKQVLRLETVNR
ncbi:MAG: histidinol-phosphate transaminase [Trueperaceae bacterium]